MCNELTEELDGARQLAAELAQHLLNMGASKASIPVQIGADSFVVAVEYDMALVADDVGPIETLVRFTEWFDQIELDESDLVTGI